MEMWWAGLESQLTPPCPLCCCTLTSSLLREGTAAPAASQLVMLEAMEALGESSDGAHLPEVTTGAVQPWPPMEMSMETSGQSHLQRLREVMGKPIPLAFHGFSPFVHLLLLVCSNLHIPFPSCSPVCLWHQKSCSTSLREVSPLRLLKPSVRHDYHLIF